jgi:hypothetical protein
MAEIVLESLTMISSDKMNEYENCYPVISVSHDENARVLYVYILCDQICQLVYISQCMEKTLIRAGSSININNCTGYNYTVTLTINQTTQSPSFELLKDACGNLSIRVNASQKTLVVALKRVLSIIDFGSSCHQYIIDDPVLSSRFHREDPVQFVVSYREGIRTAMY